ncbi:hypothetical protein ACFX15_035190 [Malus domestica]
MKLKASGPRRFQFLKPSLFTNLHRSVCSSSSIPPPPTPPKPQTPLFLRPPTHSTTAPDLQKWHDWANTLASSVGSTFVDLDNDPDSTLLRRELKWLMDDAIEEPENVDNNGESVRLRVEIEELYMLWKQKVEERRPFQYVVGCEHWRDLVLCVEEGADLGMGSGAIAIAIGIARVLGSGGRVIATDLSPAAIGLAAFNVQRYGLQDVVELRQGSWFEPLKDVEGKLSGIVSNPPYIPSANMSRLQADVGRLEPRVALDGVINGMDDLLHLCKGAAFMLKPGGFFAFERSAEVQST